MFSPSLVSMLLHSIWIDLAQQQGTVELSTAELVDKDLARLLNRFNDSSLRMPTIPIAGYSEHILSLGKHATIVDAGTQGPGSRHVFGRVPADVLVKQFHASYGRPAPSDYFDLGTSLKEAQFHVTGLQDCLAWLPSHPIVATSPTRMTVAVIDRGVDLPAGQLQETLGGRLVHVINNVDFSEHASLVLAEVIKRLASSGLLASCDLLCALIKPPKDPIGLECFKHANIVELEQAINALSTYVSNPSNRSSTLPLVTNISMGAHVGPHDGHSPLEDLIDRLLPFNLERYLVCSAGNDGMAGLSARCKLSNGTRDFMRVQTSPAGCENILVELWWEEPANSTMSIAARLYDRKRKQIGPGIFIDTTGTGQSITGNRMAVANGGFNSVICKSLFHAQCNGDFSCAAFAMSAKNAADLADLTIDIELRCDAQAHVAVNAWIVIAENDGAKFVGGGPGGSITVPATYQAAISVAGVEDSAHTNPALRPQPWQESSRGPAASYGTNGSLSPATLPKLAHRVDGSIDGVGTSFAAPRATADVVDSVLRAAATTQHPLMVQTYADADQLAKSIVTRHGIPGPAGTVPDRDRVGFGAVI